jgi:spore germination cell wall hydrolase CwlJ-like protein
MPTVSPLPDPAKSVEQQEICVLLAMMIFGEARNQPRNAKIGVAAVVRNRANAAKAEFGGTIWRSVILRKNAFSCFRADDPNSKKLLHPLQYEKALTWDACYEAAFDVYRKDVPDPTQGAVFYHDSSRTAPPVKSDGTCAWGIVERTLRIGDLTFYRFVRPPQPILPVNAPKAA